MDIWFFGFLLHKILVREVPIFDSTRKPILSKEKLSPGMFDLITRCLSLTPANRPSWNDINLKELDKFVLIEDV
jgi:serine/threonine protein kinase